MTATTVFFDGRRTAVPGVETRIDASGLEQLGLGAVGIVALVGTAEGGRPTNASTTADQIIRLNTASDNRNKFRYRGDMSAMGDIREAAAIALAPSTDPTIPAGAQQIVCIKVNQADQAATTLNYSGGTTLTVTSDDWGAFTNQINVKISAGTTAGKLVSVQFEDTANTESGDNIGIVDAAQTGNETAVFTLDYEPSSVAGATSWEAVTADVLPSGAIRAYGSLDNAGISTTATAAGGEVLTIASTDGADNGTICTVYGLDGSSDAISEAIAVGETGSTLFTTVHGAILGTGLDADASAGTVTVDNASAATLVTMATAANSGVLVGQAIFAAGTLHLVQTVGSDDQETVTVFGLDASGAAVKEALTIPAKIGSNYVPVCGTVNFARVDVVALGGVDSGNTMQLSAFAGKTVPTTHNTLQKVADYFNGRQIDNVGVGQEFGFTCALLTGTTGANPNTLDATESPTNIFDQGTHAGFSAVLQAIIDWMSTSSDLVSGTRVTFVPKVYTITVSGGDAGTWGINIDANAVVVSGTAATIAAVQDGLVAAINCHPDVSKYVTASEGSGVGEVVLTGDTPRGGGGFVATLEAAPGGGWSIAATTAEAGMGQAPSNMGAYQFLGGGSDYGTDDLGNLRTAPTEAQWQAAIDVLKEIDVNTVVPLSGDPSIHSYVQQHCATMCGEGKSERDGLVGLVAVDSGNEPTAPIALASKTSLKSQALALNSRHLRAACQTITRFDTAGTQRDFMPWYQATLAAGMQAGSTVGTSLTRKTADVLEVKQDSSWKPTPTGDASDMILSGLWFMENSRVGRRCVRNVTTYLQSTNLAFTEASVNEAANFAVFNFRNALETIIGKPGFAGTLAAGKAAATNILNQLVTEGTIVQWRSLSMTLNGDTLDVSVEIAPITPINFVKATVHLVTVTQTA